MMNFRGRKAGLLVELTSGEILWIARRRAGLNQDEAARKAGLGEKVYAAVENDEVSPPERLRKPLAALTVPEKLALARRRSGATLAQVAAWGKVTQMTVLAWERRGAAGLVAFWEKRGFRF